jgi:carbon-monoxide dehydrogenase medium subunit
MMQAHPGLPEFDYIKPASLGEASRFLARRAGEARPFLGGTDVFVRMRDGAWRDRFLVDVKGLPAMNVLAFDPDEGLTLGAAVTMNRTIEHPLVKAHYPLLAEAARSVGGYQLRNRATVAGNLCNASPAGDTLGACLAYGARLKVFSGQSEHEVPLDGFFLGPGKTPLQPGDIVTAVLLPAPPAGQAGRYLKLGRNVLSDLSIVGVTALGWPDPARPSGYGFRLALASVAPVPLVPTAAEAILSEQPPGANTFAAAAEAAMEACAPIDDARASARYRKVMVRNLVRQALTAIWEELRGSESAQGD